MTHEQQDRVEDYLELERYIKAWQAGKGAHPPTDLTPEQARMYLMATLFFSANPEQAEPRFAFVEQMKEQVRLTSISSLLSLPLATKRKETPRLVRFFSRRYLLYGGVTAAAFLVIGGGLEWVREQRARGTPAARDLKITTAVPTTWHFVTTLADLGRGTVVCFTSQTLIGYVLRDPNDPKGRTLLALSAACTHMGCLVQWEEADHRFHCPCHSALFTEDGANVLSHYRSALPCPAASPPSQDKDRT